VVTKNKFRKFKSIQNELSSLTIGKIIYY